MLFYFEFENKRRKADVLWPGHGENIIIHIADHEIANSFPTDLFFQLDESGKIDFQIEDVANIRLLDLQNTLRRRLQDLT